ncbi:MAG: cytochrome b/b6 domain-containing protein [Rhodospirillales bacterium]|nr:cytochrome b/b6 domain-containing protein [Rhodospirillales bacterium]
MPSILKFLRAYHAVLAILVVLAYATGETGRIHAWLGYGVAGAIVLRLVAAATGLRHLGLSRFYPIFDGLKLGNAMTHPAISRTLLAAIAACLIGVTASGIAMDRGRAIGVATINAPAPPEAGGGERGSSGSGRRRDADRGGGVLDELHEWFANLLVFLVGAHVAYLLLFKRPLARFMLFIDKPRS